MQHDDAARESRQTRRRPRQPVPLRRAPWRALTLGSRLVLIVAVGLGGCRLTIVDLEPRTDATRYYQLQDIATEPMTGPEWLRGQVLQLEPFTTASRYDERFFESLTGNRVRMIENRRWVRTPGILFSERLEEALVQSQLTRNVVGLDTTVEPDLRLSGTVQRFEWGQDSAGATVAAMKVTAVLVASGRSAPDPGAALASGASLRPRILWQQVFAATEPVTPGPDSDAAFVEAMSRSVSRVRNDLLKALAATKP